jgi:hypothetical protein
MSESVTLWDDALAPVTSAMGFLCAPLEEVVDGLSQWRREIHGSVRAARLEGGLRANVAVLEPLTGGVRPRELVVATRNPQWSAVFDCGVQGGDQVSTVGFLARELQTQGVVVCSIPDVPAGDPWRPERFGARQFEMFGPLDTDFLNYVRTISVVRDGARWRFDAGGTVQDFEDVEAYKRRKVTERFTADMLVDYAAALGLEPFDDEFFPGPCVLVSNPATPPPGGAVLSLRDARRWAGLDAD